MSFDSIRKSWNKCVKLECLTWNQINPNMVLMTESQTEPAPHWYLKIWMVKKNIYNVGLGEKNRNLSPFEWFIHSLSESGWLGQLISHAWFQALDSNSSIRTLVDTHEEEAAVSVEFPMEKKEVQPSRWGQANAGGKERKQALGRESLGFGGTSTIYPFLSLGHTFEYIENEV